MSNHTAPSPDTDIDRVVAYLDAHPVVLNNMAREALIWQYNDPGILLTPQSRPISEHFKRERERVRRWFRAGDYGICASCYYEIAFLPDGTKFDLEDEVTIHECATVAS